jgi:predicted DNA-binding transcriptional regulator AlpA
MPDHRPKSQRLPREFIGGPAVCARYAITDMTLWRWLADTALNFPAPAMRIRGRRFWRLADLENWEANFVPRGGQRQRDDADAA